MIEILLTKGYIATIDDIDAELANKKWHTLTQSNREYAARRIYGETKTFLLHREIMERVVGRPLDRKELVDHIDGNGLNNCRSNLRLATDNQNLKNRRRRSDSTSGYKGASNCLSFHRDKRYMANICANGKRRYLGVFTTALEAHRAYCIAALRYHGEYANFGKNSPFEGWTLADFEQQAS